MHANIPWSGKNKWGHSCDCVSGFTWNIGDKGHDKKGSDRLVEGPPPQGRIESDESEDEDAFKDAFALSEEAKAKKARDAMLIAQDEAECGDDCWIGDKYYSHEENRRRKAKDRGGYFY